MQQIKEAIFFGVFATLAMTATGAIIIPLVSNLSPLWQNFIYTVGRLPILAVAFYAFQGVLSCKKK